MTNLVLTISLVVSTTTPPMPNFINVSNNLPCKVYVSTNLVDWNYLGETKHAGQFKYPAFFYKQLFFRAQAF